MASKTNNMRDERLIELVKQNSFLYDKKHKDYRKQLLCESKWHEIGAELNVSGEIVKKRWKTIKDRYHRLKKQKQTGNQRVTNYRFSNILDFLDDCNPSDESVQDDLTDQTVGPSKLFKQNGFLESGFSNPGSNDDQQCFSPTNNGQIEVKREIDEMSKSPPTEAGDAFPTNSNDVMLSLLSSLKENSRPMTKERAFCESLSLQLEDAELPSENFRNFQIKVIQLLSDEISIVKAKN